MFVGTLAVQWVAAHENVLWASVRCQVDCQWGHYRRWVCQQSDSKIFDVAFDHVPERCSVQLSHYLLTSGPDYTLGGLPHLFALAVVGRAEKRLFRKTFLSVVRGVLADSWVDYGWFGCCKTVIFYVAANFYHHQAADGFEATVHRESVYIRAAGTAQDCSDCSKNCFGIHIYVVQNRGGKKIIVVVNISNKLMQIIYFWPNTIYIIYIYRRQFSQIFTVYTNSYIQEAWARCWYWNGYCLQIERF